jgi:L-fucose mutarotase
MRPDEGPNPACWDDYQALIGPEPGLVDVPRAEFYAACKQPDLAVCIASGDDRHYANILLTVGAVAPSR